MPQDIRQQPRHHQGPSNASSSTLVGSGQTGFRNSPAADHETARRNPSPARSNIRNGQTPNLQALDSRERTISSRTRDPSRNRPPSITVPALSPAATPPAPRQTRTVSNAASTYSQTPSVISANGPSVAASTSNNYPSRDSRAGRDTNNQSRISLATTVDAPRSRNASPAPSSIQNPPSRKYTARGDSSFPVEHTTSRRDQNARISYFDPTNQAILDRLLAQNTDSQIDVDGEEESARATLTNVEEMIEGYEWVSDDVIGRKSTRGAVDLIQARLLDELTALEKVRVLRSRFSRSD
jgi:exocyst complex component 1